MSTRAASIRTAAALAASLLSFPVLAAEPCGSLHLEGGEVKTGTALRPILPLDAASSACLSRIGGELGGRSGLRTVTVVLRAPDASRAAGGGSDVVDAYVRGLVAAGLPSARVSGVIARGEGAGEVRIAFAERARPTDVARVGSATGDVRSGPSEAAATPAVSGTRLALDTWLVTGGGGRALLDLADGSSLRVRPDTALHLKRLVLDANLNRVVDLEVKRGGVDAAVAPAEKGGRFEVKTPYATAGVRGTSFRVDLTSGDSLRLETLSGQVELAGSNGTVTIAAGEASRVGSDGAPSVPRAVPGEPRVTAGRGVLPAGGLAWEPVPGAAGYVVELARDAEFVLEVRSFDVGAGGTALAIEAPAPGTWFWHVAGRTGDGFTGAWSRTYGFHVGP